MIKRLAVVAVLLAAHNSSMILCSRSSLAQTPEEIEELNRRVFSFPTPEFAIMAPDLIVNAAGLRGEPAFQQSGQSAKIHVPFQVLVRNQGHAMAGPFKVAVEYTAMDQPPLIVPFSVPGAASSFYPSTSKNLLPGELAIFDGELIFFDDHQGQTVSVRAIADSCSGEEFAPAYCAVAEFFELNNRSPFVPIDLPTP
jgi:hypothetical protein